MMSVITAERLTVPCLLTYWVPLNDMQLSTVYYLRLADELGVMFMAGKELLLEACVDLGECYMNPPFTGDLNIRYLLIVKKPVNQIQTAKQRSPFRAQLYTAIS